jgi:5'-nucleotidase (lipoprotein e(P4) family)
VRNSAEYRAAAIQAYRSATVAVEAAASERKPGTWGVILDADETVLDNAQYQQERAEQGLGFSPDSWAEWVCRRSAPALPGAVAFLRRVRELTGVIAIVTNRTEAQCADTDANLRQVQIAFDLLLCKPNDGSDDKNTRFESVVRGTASPAHPPLDVVAWVGDNIRDFPQLSQELRRAPEDAFAEFGRRFFVIPNPLYGSWEKNP